MRLGYGQNMIKSMKLTWRHTCICDNILPWLAFQIEVHFILCARRVEGKWRGVVDCNPRCLQDTHTHTHNTCDIPPFTACPLWSTVDLFINWCFVRIGTSRFKYPHVWSLSWKSSLAYYVGTPMGRTNQNNTLCRHFTACVPVCCVHFFRPCISSFACALLGCYGTCVACYFFVWINAIILYLKGLSGTEKVRYFTMQVSTTLIPGVVSRGVIVLTDFQFALRSFSIMITGVRRPSQYGVWQWWNNMNSIRQGQELSVCYCNPTFSWMNPFSNELASFLLVPTFQSRWSSPSCRRVFSTWRLKTV